MKLCGAILFFLSIKGLSNAFHLSKDEKGDTAQAFSATTDVNEFHLENRFGKRSSSDDVDIRTVHMSVYMQKKTIQYSREGKHRYSNTADIAEHIKVSLDGHGGGKYHCIVGSSFGFYVTYNLNYYFYFKLGDLYILVFRH
ncbi:uncharacterized protein LOC134684137 [Mytilus trossulus]|uniref:uncharacterized protein LOC134684137 n=1 Tax=Mytilus trossulus TaxID=6551 RepID=UPI0030076153